MSDDKAMALSFPVGIIIDTHLCFNATVVLVVMVLFFQMIKAESKRRVVLCGKNLSKEWGHCFLWQDPRLCKQARLRNPPSKQECVDRCSLSEVSLSLFPQTTKCEMAGSTRYLVGSCSSLRY